MRPLRQVSPLGLGQVRSKMDALGPVVNAHLDKQKFNTILTYPNFFVGSQTDRKSLVLRFIM